MGENKGAIVDMSLRVRADKGGSRLSMFRSEDLIGEYREVGESGSLFETARAEDLPQYPQNIM